MSEFFRHVASSVWPNEDAIGRILAWLRSSGPADWCLVALGFVAAWSALRTLKAIEAQVSANAVSADAAKKSAEIAGLQLRAAVQPYLDLKALQIGTVNFLAYGTTGVSVEYKLYNASPNLAFVPAVTIRFRFGSRETWIELIDSIKDITISPQRGYPVGMWLNDMTAEEHKKFQQDELHISMEVIVKLKDVLGNEISQTLRREILCGAKMKPQSFLSSFQEEADET